MVDEESPPQFKRPEVDNWWRNVLRSPKYVVAPMVDASELPWRLLSRRYNADLCFTPMIHSRNFLKDMKYRKDNLSPCMCPEDRPLIVQFCGNDPSVLAEAATIVKDYCDGVDINLGCPQAIAKRGNYGAFLQNEWDLLTSIVQNIASLGIPVSCKIRVFADDIEKTVQYAKMLEAAGCWMLTVHGRTIDQRGPLTGLAKWEYIKAVKEAVNVPVLANGNIQYLSDVFKCMSETRVNGVMSAEGNLHNPALFSGIQPPVWEMALQYLDLVSQYPCPLGYTRGHIFKLFQHILALEDNMELREVIAKAPNLDVLRNTVLTIKSRYEHKDPQSWIAEKRAPKEDVNTSLEEKILPFAPWICQPYERPPPISSTLPKPRRASSLTQTEDPPGVSRNRLKRMKRNPHKDWNAVRVPMTLCKNCKNPTGPKCDCCRKCCRQRCQKEFVDCDVHSRFITTKDQIVINAPSATE